MSDTQSNPRPTQTSSQLADGWGRPLRAVICNRCDWGYLVGVDETEARCPHCFHPALAPLPDAQEALPYVRPPELIIPFSLSQELLARRVEAFAQGIPFAPQDLNAAALQQRLEPLYLPMWLVDAEAEARWEAEVGFDYQVVSHQERYADHQGGWATREVEETRVRWEPRVGELHRTYPNVAAPALEEDTALRQRLGEWDWTKAQAYDGLLLGPVPGFGPLAHAPDRARTREAWIRLPNRTPQDAWPAAEPTVRQQAAKECRRAAGADHVRQFRWTPTYPERNWTLLLAPIYTTYYIDDEGAPQPVLIHGQTGRLHGARRASMHRAQRTSLILALVALGIFIVSLVIAAAGLVAPPVAVLGGVGILLALVIGLGALVPIVRVWQFNRQTQSAQRL